MSTYANAPRPRHPLWMRLFFLIPFVGWMVRDTLEHGEDNLYYGTFGIASAWMISFLIFGYPGLILPALALVPIILLTLIAITWG